MTGEGVVGGVTGGGDRRGGDRRGVTGGDGRRGLVGEGVVIFFLPSFLLVF